MYKYLILLSLINFHYLYAAMESDYKLWKLREEIGADQQKRAPIIIKAEVLSVTQKKLSQTNPPLLSISLRIKPIQPIRNKRKTDIPRILRFTYKKIDFRSGWVGPASSHPRTPIVPEKGKAYTFYLNDKLEFSANEFSIEEES